MGFAALGGKTHHYPKTSCELPSAARSQAKRGLLRNDLPLCISSPRGGGMSSCR